MISKSLVLRRVTPRLYRAGCPGGGTGWPYRSGGVRSPGALTARMTRSCSPSSVARAAARTGDVTRPSAISSRQPLPRKDSSVAPRAMALTSAAPDAESREPIQPPMAPAPTTHTFVMRAAASEPAIQEEG